MAYLVAVLMGIALGLYLLADTQGLFGEGSADVKESRTDALITRLRANVELAFINQADLGDDTDLVPTLISLGKVPSNAMNADGDGIVHPYGGTITILGDGERFAITLEELDDEECARTGTKLAGAAGSDAGVVNIEVGDAEVDEVNEDEAENKSVADITGACAEGAGANYLTFTFR